MIIGWQLIARALEQREKSFIARILPANGPKIKFYSNVYKNLRFFPTHPNKVLIKTAPLDFPICLRESLKWPVLVLSVEVKIVFHDAEEANF